MEEWGVWRAHRLQALLQGDSARQVFEVIWHYGPITRNQVAELTGLAIPTVSRITAELLQAGLIREIAHLESQRGRRPTLLTINPDCGYILGLDLGGTKLVTLLINLEARVIARHQVILDEETKGKDALRRLLIHAIEKAITRLGVTRERLIGIGLGVPGSIDHATGMIIEASNLAVKRWPVREELEAALGLPVYVENDANVAALGELFFGAGRMHRNLAVITLGTGVGMGLILNEVIFHGDLGQAGEFGHMVVAREGPPCTCGNRGCLEAFVGGWALPQRYQEAGGEGVGISPLTAAEVFRLARAGDPIAQRVIAEAADYLGMGIASVLNLLSLRLIVLGGGLIEGNAFFVQAIRKATIPRLIPELRGQVRLIPSPLGRNLGALGSAALVLQQVFSKGGCHE
jgi:glucokinase